MRRSSLLVAVAVLVASAPLAAFVGFVTVAERQEVAVTIYNSADLSLVRDRRNVVLKKGVNAMRFEWAGTLIDPTSVLPFPPAGVDLVDTAYPLDHGEALVWNLKADKTTSGPLAVQYFTSGLSWRADHLVTLTAPGRADVETWITVTNGSGEDYTDTRFRLVVGEVRLVERIAEIAQRFRQEAQQYAVPEAPAAVAREMMMEMEDSMGEGLSAKSAAGAVPRHRAMKPKDVERESLSELHLYSIEGTENVPNGGARRMRAFAYGGVEVKDVYRCVDPWGKVDAQRVVSFKNARENRMGTQPLPEGQLLLYRARRDGLSWDGRGAMPYTPMGEEAETPLGINAGVTCEAWMKNVSRRNIQKDSLGRTVGWEDVRDYELTLVNGAPDTAQFEVRQHQDAPFTTTLKGATQEDAGTLLYKADVDARGTRTVKYQVATKRGTLAVGKGR